LSQVLRHLFINIGIFTNKILWEFIALTIIYGIKILNKHETSI
jgi:hypothetical protein